MKVHITSTPEYPIKIVREVVDILNQTKGYLEFEFAEPFTYEQIVLYNAKFESPQKIKKLTFDEFFHLCHCFRISNKIPKEDYIVMVTSIGNTSNNNHEDWFSAFKNNDIFIYGLEWEYYTKHDDKFGIAYEVVENIFQSQIKLDIDDLDNEPNIHSPSIGCINDMCSEKVDIMWKLRTAEICDSCIERAVEKKVEPLLLQHIIQLIEELRREFVNSNKVASKFKPKEVYIDSDRIIKIGGKEFETWPIQKVLFIFFLKNNKGVETQLVCDYQDELYDIYQEIRNPADITPIKNLFDKKKIGDSSFIYNKSKLNTALKEFLGKSLADYYIITKVVVEDGTHVYKIGLDDKYIRIDPKQ